MQIADEAVDFYLMASLSGRLTGLPFIVWISQRGNAKHDVCVKVTPGLKAIPEEMVSVAIGPDIRVIAGEMTASDLQLLTRWIELNSEVIFRFWEGELLTEDALLLIKAID